MNYGQSKIINEKTRVVRRPVVVYINVINDDIRAVVERYSFRFDDDDDDVYRDAGEENTE